jgi:hypothetical protein
MIECLSEKYNIPADEMIQAVYHDERIVKAMDDPVIHTLGYFDKDLVETQLAKKETVPESEVAAVPAVPAVPAVTPVTKKKVIRKKVQEAVTAVPEAVTAVQEPVTAVQEPVSAVPTPPAPAPAKRVFKKKA